MISVRDRLEEAWVLAHPELTVVETTQKPIAKKMSLLAKCNQYLYKKAKRHETNLQTVQQVNSSM